MSNKYTPQFLSHLRQGMMESFNVEEFRSLCSELNIDHENLGGEGKDAKIRELIAYLNRRGQLPELIKKCLSDRPQYPWQFDNAKLTLSQTILPDAGRGINILFLASDPTDLSRLRLGEELREIQEKLQLAKLRDRFNLHQHMSVRPADISQALLDVQPQIVHFSGHGASTGELCFEDQLGHMLPVQPDALAALFQQFSPHVKCVILNACYSEIQADAIARHIDFVIGMNQAVGDRAAIAFAVGFYQALGAGRPIEDAYQLGCAQIQLQGSSEHLMPVLIKKRALPVLR